jgi:Aspartyl protease
LPHAGFTYDVREVPSLDVLVQAKGGPQRFFTGIVDSGASRTVLSLKEAEKLGLSESDLTDDGTVTVADESRVICLTPLIPIRAQVLHEASPGDDLIPWGPVFDLDVVFLEHATPLWGQTDFFQTFKVTFERYLNPQRFTLDY